MISIKNSEIVFLTGTKDNMKTDKLQLQRLAQGLLAPVIALNSENEKEQLLECLKRSQEFTSFILESIHKVQ